jgi:hypothetical protein
VTGGEGVRAGGIIIIRKLSRTSGHVGSGACDPLQNRFLLVKDSDSGVGREWRATLETVEVVAAPRVTVRVQAFRGRVRH